MNAGVDVSHLSPRDAIAALRSYPRRYRGVMTSFEKDERPDDLLHRAGPDGLSAVDHADHAARAIGMLGEAIRRTLVDREPVVLAATVDDEEREWAVGLDTTSEAALDFVTTECNGLAEQLESVGGDTWNRRAKVAGGDRTVTVLDLSREAVRTGSDHLRAAQAAIDYARRH